MADTPQQPQPPSYTDKDLYGQSGQPQAQDIAQYKLGDCYYISPLSALAHQQPERIENAIHYDAGKGSFSVTLYQSQHSGFLGLGHETKPVQVEVTQADIQKDIAVGGSSQVWNHPGQKEPMWPAVMEAAYAKFSEKKGQDLDQGFTNIGGGDGGFSKDAVYTLTGEKTENLSASSMKHMGLDETYTKLDTALKEGRPLLLGTNYMKDTPNDNLVKGDKGHGHEYIVEGISKNADGNVQLSLRNPWGRNDDLLQGVNVKGAIVNVDLKTVLDNGHLDSIDIGPKALEKTQNQEQNKNQEQQKTTQISTGDPTFDKLLNSLGDHDATTKALQELAQSPSGQAFHAEGRAQYAEFQNQQLQAQLQATQQQFAQQQTQVQTGPVMSR